MPGGPMRRIWLARRVRLTIVVLVFARSSAAATIQDGIAAPGTAAVNDTSTPQEECDCKDIRLHARPVCSLDGQVFMNECVSFCQGLQVQQQGPLCAEAQASPLHASAKRWIEEAEPGGSTKAVSQKIVERFRAKGYSFAGTAYSITTGHGEFEHEGPPMESAEGARGFQRPSVNLRSNRQLLSVRVTADGFIYTKPVPPPPGAGGTAYSPLGGVARQEQRRRPGDDRDDWRSPSSSGSTASDPAPGVPRGLLALRETEMHGFPWSAIGHVTPQCSGALIAPNKVLTAGHCVWSATTGAFVAGGDFVANQHGGEARAHGHSSYLARQAWRDTTFVGATALPCSDGALKCFQWEDYQLDFAVITLEEDVSSMYGAFGLDTSCGRESLPITAAGYPADRPGFPLRMFYDTSILSAFDSCTDDESEGIVTSGIETQPGQSGSAIWVQRGDESLIRAIHIASGPAHRGVTAWMVDRIEEWTS